MSFGGLGGGDQEPKLGRDDRQSQVWQKPEDEGKILRRSARQKKQKEFLRKLWPGNWGRKPKKK